MLIKCPECQKEISDKSETCIHCGYPLKNLIDKSNYCKINNKEVDLTEVIEYIKKNRLGTAARILRETQNISTCAVERADSDRQAALFLLDGMKNSNASERNHALLRCYSPCRLKGIRLPSGHCQLLLYLS